MKAFFISIYINTFVPEKTHIPSQNLIHHLISSSPENCSMSFSFTAHHKEILHHYSIFVLKLTRLEDSFS